MKDLINDDEEEENDDSDSDAGGKKRKHDDDDESGNDDLDEDDLALLQENLGVKFTPKQKKRKRIKQVIDEDSDGEENVPQAARDIIANELFDGKLHLSLCCMLLTNHGR